MIIFLCEFPQKYCGKTLDPYLAGKLTTKLSEKDPNGEGFIICPSKFLEFFGRLFKGTVEEKVDCTFVLASSGCEESLAREQIVLVGKC